MIVIFTLLLLTPLQIALDPSAMSNGTKFVGRYTASQSGVLYHLSRKHSTTLKTMKANLKSFFISLKIRKESALLSFTFWILSMLMRKWLSCRSRE